MAVRKMASSKYFYSYFRDEYGKLHTISTRQTDRAKAEQIDRANMDIVNSRRSKLNLLKFASPELVEKMQSSPAPATIHPTTHRTGVPALKSLFSIADSKRPQTREASLIWQHFCDNIGVIYADEVTPKMCQDYLDRFFAQRKAKTWNNKKSILNTIFRLTIVETALQSSPFAPIMNRILNDVESHRNLTAEEIDLIMSKGDDLIRIMTMLSRWTGQRLETCAKMTFNEFDFDKKVYLKQPGKTARFNKWVCIPLFPPLEDFLLSMKSKIRKKDIPIVHNFGYCSDHAFSRKFMDFIRSLKICHNKKGGTACFHSLRGSFITWAKDAGISADVRRSITGHSTLSMEDIYAKSIQSVSEVARSMTGGCM